MLTFEPLTEEQIQYQSLVPEGVYNCQIIKAESKVSHAGNDMIEVQFKFWDNDGRELTKYDWFTSNKWAMRKLRHAAEIFGFLEHYEQGKVTADDFKPGAHGKIDLGISKNKNGQMENSIKDYVKEGGGIEKGVSNKKTDLASTEGFDDDIPF